jgi:hypothetical protein
VINICVNYFCIFTDNLEDTHYDYGGGNYNSTTTTSNVQPSKEFRKVTRFVEGSFFRYF